MKQSTNCLKLLQVSAGSGSIWSHWEKEVQSLVNGTTNVSSGCPVTLEITEIPLENGLLLSFKKTFFFDDRVNHV